MAEPIAEAIVKITADIEGLKKQFGDVEEALKKTTKSTNDAGESLVTNLKAHFITLGTTIAAAFSVSAIQQFMTESLNAYNEQVDAEAKLTAALEASGKAANLSVSELSAYAGELQNSTKFADEVIIGVEGIIAGFKGIDASQVKDLTATTLDLATLMGGDATGAARALGLALESPESATRVLRQAGIALSDSQKEQIQRFIELGDKASAQAVILDLIKEKTHGYAETAAQAGSGPMVQLQNAFGDIQEVIGQVISIAINPLIESLKTSFQELSANGNSIRDVMVPAMSTLVTVISGVAQGINGLALVFDIWKAGMIQAIQSGLDGIAKLTGALGLEGLSQGVKGYADDWRSVTQNVETDLGKIFDSHAKTQSNIESISTTTTTALINLSDSLANQQVKNTQETLRKHQDSDNNKLKSTQEKTSKMIEEEKKQEKELLAFLSRADNAYKDDQKAYAEAQQRKTEAIQTYINDALSLEEKAQSDKFALWQKELEQQAANGKLNYDELTKFQDDYYNYLVGNADRQIEIENEKLRDILQNHNLTEEELKALLDAHGLKVDTIAKNTESSFNNANAEIAGNYKDTFNDLSKELSKTFETMLVDSLKGEIKTSSELWDSYKNQVIDIIGVTVGKFVEGETTRLITGEATNTALAASALVASAAIQAAYAAATMGISLVVSIAMSSITSLFSGGADNAKETIFGVKDAWKDTTDSMTQLAQKFVDYWKSGMQEGAAFVMQQIDDTSDRFVNLSGKSQNLQSHWNSLTNQSYSLGKSIEATGLNSAETATQMSTTAQTAIDYALAASEAGLASDDLTTVAVELANSMQTQEVKTRDAIDAYDGLITTLAEVDKRMSGLANTADALTLAEDILSNSTMFTTEQINNARQAYQELTDIETRRQEIIDALTSSQNLTNAEIEAMNSELESLNETAAYWEEQLTGVTEQTYEAAASTNALNEELDNLDGKSVSYTINTDTGQLGAVTASAKGNVFDSSGIVPYANGGIVTQPTLFGFGNNQTGLMGESGAEAIMPLARDSQGDLGVKVADSMGGALNATVQLVLDGAVLAKSLLTMSKNGQLMIDGRAVKSAYVV